MYPHQVAGCQPLACFVIAIIHLLNSLPSSCYFHCSTLRGREGTVDWDAVASNRSTGSYLSNYNKRINSNNSTWCIWARRGFPTVSSPLPIRASSPWAGHLGEGHAAGRNTVTGVCKKHTPFTWALALQHGSGNCSPAPDLVFCRLIFLHVVSSGGMFFHRHR